LLVSCNAQDDQAVIPSTIKGVSFVAMREAMTSVQAQEVKGYNANFVAVHPYGFMRDVDNPTVMYNSDRQWQGERVDGTRESIEQFHRQGLRVMLKPQIWIGRGMYTGTIQLKTDADWKMLEDSYEKFILAFAQVAQETNTELYCIGTELESFALARPDYWQQLIRKIKEIYKGKLTYAANWDSYSQVPFWTQMDYIGVDAYFPVSDQITPDIATATAGWKQWKMDLSNLSLEYDKKILFTEYGYVSADYAGREPWKNADESRAKNMQAQQNLLQAQYDAVWNEDWHAGGFLWKHHGEKSMRGFGKRFTTQEKPAEKAVREFYGKS
jgi:hypothetical protein